MRFLLLDPLRGLAALWVLCVHYQFSEQFQNSLPSLHQLAKAGELGVAMFFVISGYCLSASAIGAIRRDESVGLFLKRRFRRIYPPLWISIAVVCSIPFIIESLSYLKTGTYLFPSASNPRYGFLDYSWADWLGVAALTRAFNQTGETIGDKFTSVNAVYWSLAIEVQFYVVVGIAILLKQRFFVGLAIVSLVSLPFALAPLWYIHGMFLPWWPMFAWGILLFWLLRSNMTPKRLFGRHAGKICAGLLFALIATTVFWLGKGGEVSQQAFAPAFALFLWLAWPFDDMLPELADSPRRLIRASTWIFVGLGAISYSLYLIHGRLQYLVIQVVRQVLPEETVLRDVVVVVIVVLGCVPFYYFAERPFISSLRSNPRVDSPSTDQGGELISASQSSS